jgi:STIMATE family
MIAAIIINRDHGGEVQLDDQCAWYGIAYLVDTTLGLLLAVWGLKIVDILAHKNDWVSLKHNGVYEGVDGILHWINQCVAWMVILSVVKVIIYYVMVLLSTPLAYFGSILFAPLQANIRFELLFVMIFFPGFLNVIYFWVADSFLQASSDQAGAHEDEEAVTEMNEKKESLLPDADGPTSTLI